MANKLFYIILVFLTTSCSNFDWIGNDTSAPTLTGVRENIFGANLEENKFVTLEISKNNNFAVSSKIGLKKKLYQDSNFFLNGDNFYYLDVNGSINNVEVNNLKQNVILENTHNKSFLSAGIFVDNNKIVYVLDKDVYFINNKNLEWAARISSPIKGSISYNNHNICIKTIKGDIECVTSNGAKIVPIKNEQMDVSINSNLTGPVFINQHSIVSSTDRGYLIAYNINNLSVDWICNIAFDDNSFMSGKFSGVNLPIFVYNNYVIANNFFGGIFAISKNNGSIIWHYPNGLNKGLSYSKNIMAVLSNDNILKFIDLEKGNVVKSIKVNEFVQNNIGDVLLIGDDWFLSSGKKILHGNVLDDKKASLLNLGDSVHKIIPYGSKNILAVSSNSIFVIKY